MGPGTPLQSRVVLLVEDDETLRHLLKEFLHFGRYQVLSCSDGLRAMDLCRYGDIDLLLTDYQMPFMSGLELADLFSAAKPHTPIVMMSGSMLSLEEERQIASEGWYFLQKPFLLPEMLQLLESVLRVPAVRSLGI